MLRLSCKQMKLVPPNKFSPKISRKVVSKKMLNLSPNNHHRIRLNRLSSARGRAVIKYTSSRTTSTGISDFIINRLKLINVVFAIRNSLIKAISRSIWIYILEKGHTLATFQDAIKDSNINPGYHLTKKQLMGSTLPMQKGDHIIIKRIKMKNSISLPYSVEIFWCLHINIIINQKKKLSWEMSLQLLSDSISRFTLRWFPERVRPIKSDLKRENLIKFKTIPAIVNLFPWLSSYIKHDVNIYIRPHIIKSKI